MNALVTQTHFTDTTATSSLGQHTVFTPQAQGAFLASLAHQGNVRLACRAASVSAQTAYRARRRSAGFARAWDAALVSARVVAEDALADRALNGWEEAVFYHGEEVARRRRFSDRLLLAHLARLDALAARVDVEAGLAVLDDQIEALQRGEALSERNQPYPVHPEPVAQSAVFDSEGVHFTSRDGSEEKATFRQAQGSRKDDQDPVPSVPSCRDCGGNCDVPYAQDDGLLGPDDCQWLGNRTDRMEAARPEGAIAPQHMAYDPDEVRAIEALQLEAFEADGHEWWLVSDEATLIASCIYGHEEEGEEEEPCA